MNFLPKWRFKVLVIFFLSISVVILVCYSHAMLYRELKQIDRENAMYSRGKILDRNGIILADELPRYDVKINPPRRNRINILANELAPILDLSEEYIIEQIRSNEKQFFIKQLVDLETKKEIEKVRDKITNVNEIVIDNALPLRIYPQGELAKDIIGYTDAFNAGKEGVEWAFDKILKGKENGEEGNNIILSIDINIQRILEKKAALFRERYDAETAAFFAIDPRSGEILGAAINAKPKSDPNKNPFLWTTQFEPGSVFKIFTIAAMLDYGGITENSEFLCTGIYDKVNPPISCLNQRPHGLVKARDIITLSCNVGAALASETIDIQTFNKMLENFGFNKKTEAVFNGASSETTETGFFPSEAAGNLNKPGDPKYSNRTKPTVAFGQEINATVLQMLQAASVIANNGILVKPKYIARIESFDGKITIKDFISDDSGRQVINPSTAAKMRSYMMDAALYGTGRLANLPYHSIAVKTGTAQIYAVNGYSSTDYLSSCIAILPAEYSSLVLYVAIDRPKGETYGSLIAAPAIKETAEEIISYVGIPPGQYTEGYLSGDNIFSHSGNIDIREEILPELRDEVPSYIGISKKTINRLLENNDIQVEMSGSGWVKYQSPAPGTKVTSGMVITLIFE
ncbi:MAG: transpeptidase family protein [Treponema sp.]|nr:transpeptidase family protein [Treponema sp.]